MLEYIEVYCGWYVYIKNDCITEEEFVDYAETGDILLF